MPELCQWVININYFAARLRQIYSKPAARFICMVKTNCRNLAVGLRQSSSKLAARSPLALPQGLFFGKGLYGRIPHRSTILKYFPICRHKYKQILQGVSFHHTLHALLDCLK